MKNRYDVVVVGAGPSGLVAAKALKENGLDVAVLDRRSDPTKTERTCGQTLLPPNEYFFDNLFHYNQKDQRFCFIDSGLSFPYDGPIGNIYCWHMYSPGMKEVRFGSGEQPAPGCPAAPIALSYDKDVMLECLVRDIACDHVDLFAGHEFTDIRWEGPDVVVQAGGKDFRSTFVIAADGCNSRVVEKLGYNRGRHHIADFYIKSYFLKGCRPEHPGDLTTAITHIDGKPVYLFFVPRPDGDSVNFLMLTFEKSIDLSGVYAAAAADEKYRDWFAGAEVIREYAAFERIYASITRPFRNNVLIVGDAGSCQELECLGAMATGWKGGLAVAGALKEAQLGIPPQAIPRYQDWWLNAYIKNYDYEDYLSVFSLVYALSSTEIIDYIFEKLGQQPFPPTFNPYTAVKHIGLRLQQIIPEIMAERPDVLMQMMPGMLTFPSEVLSRTLEK